MIDAARFVLAVVHIGCAAVWFGSMVYSLFVVQPRAAVLFDRADDEEAFATAVATGNRPRVLALVAALGASGLGLAAVEWADRADASSVPALWVLVLGTKLVVLGVALGVFVHVSWRLWPARLFAAPAELPVVRTRFRRAAIALLGLVGVDLVLGVAATMVE